MGNAYDLAYEELFAGDGKAIDAYLSYVRVLRSQSVTEESIGLCYELGSITGAAYALRIYDGCNLGSWPSTACNKTRTEDREERLAEHSANVLWDVFPKEDTLYSREEKTYQAFLRGWHDGYRGNVTIPAQMTEHLERLRHEAEENDRKRKAKQEALPPREKLLAHIQKMNNQEIQTLLSSLQK